MGNQKFLEEIKELEKELERKDLTPKERRNIMGKIWYRKNKEKSSAESKERYEKNVEERRLKSAEYYEKNKEQILQKSKNKHSKPRGRPRKS
jgi:hypothetical protein